MSSFIAIGLVVPQVILALAAFREPTGSDPANPLVSLTAVVPMALWFFAMIGFAPRAAWCAGCSAFLLHVAVAFHLAHGASHVEAMSHVERSSGWGEGIYVSYAFAVVWLADAVWIATAPSSYFQRPRWLSLAVEGFLAFIVFNATVVYGHGLARWLGAALFATMIILKTNVAGRSPPRRDSR
jgi:hypothetical protein